MRKISLVLLLFGTLSLQAGKIDRAFKALEKFDYFKAKELFSKVLERKIVAAPYGLSLIYSKDDNPFYHLDSAYKFILLAENNFPNLKLREKEKLLKYAIDSSAIQQLKDQIDRKAYLTIKDSLNVQLFQAYIDRHTDSDFLDKVILKRDQLAFSKAKIENTAKAYRDFFTRYPDANQYVEARNRYEQRLFIENTRKGKPADYNYFIKNYPQSPYVSAALDSIYAYYSKFEDIKQYHQFIQNNPEHPKVNQAWREMYKLYTTNYSPERIVEFRIEYPDYPFVEELKQDIRLASKQFLPFKKENKWGFMDRNGKLMIPAVYDWVEPFSEGLALVIKSDQLGFIDKSGKLVIPFQYEEGESFQEGLAIVSKDGKFGMIDRNNHAVIPLKYELIGSFYSSLAVVADEENYGYVNKKGEVIIPLELEYAKDFDKGYAVVQLNGKMGMINTIGKLSVSAEYQWLETFNQYGLARAKGDSLYGILNQNGSVKLPFQYDRIGEFSHGLSLIAAGGKYGYIDRIAETKIPLDFDFIPEAVVWGKFESGYTKFLHQRKYGIIDSAGNKIFPAIFEDVKSYHPTQLVAVKKRGKWGYTNQSLKLVIPYQYDEAFTFQHERGIIKQEERYGIIDPKGKYLIDAEYTKIEPLGNGYLLDSLGVKGWLKNDLTPGLKVEYQNIEKSDFEGLFRLEKEGVSLYYDPEERTIIKPQED